MYLNLNEIEQLTVELTTRCNAACPMCSRYNVNWDTRSPNKQLPMIDFDIEVFKNFLPPKIISNIKMFLFNGKFGDPLMHKNFIDFVKYIKNNSNASILTHTNASLRNEIWWAELGNILDSNDIVSFNIDGLSDTNSLYRQKTNFEKIIKNAKAFITAGGTADWEYIVFKHNEHQVDEAKLLAKKIGFKNFIVRKTSRFKDTSKFNFVNILGQSSILEPPSSSKYKYDYNGTYLGGDTPPKNLCIECDWKSKKKMFISPTYRLWPCTYISEYYPELPGFNTMQEIANRHGTDFNDITKHSLQEILNHDFFANELETAWATGKNITKECWKKCSVSARSITVRKYE